MSWDLGFEIFDFSWSERIQSLAWFSHHTPTNGTHLDFPAHYLSILQVEIGYAYANAVIIIILKLNEMK